MSIIQGGHIGDESATLAPVENRHAVYAYKHVDQLKVQIGSDL